MHLISGLAGLLAVMALQGPAGKRQSVEQALDQPLRLELTESALTDACAALSRQTGVEIILAPETLDALPHGGDTKVTATLRNVSLREGLTRFLAPLCLQFEVSELGIEVAPHPALLRIGRRATWTELDVLRSLQEARWNSAKDAEAWQPRIQFRVDSQTPWTDFSAALGRTAAGPADQMLTAACDALGWTWHPQAVDRVVILARRDHLRKLLEGRVSLRTAHKPLTEVLQQLARKARVPMRVEAAAIAALPLQTRENFSLLAERITVTEALDQIAAATGLSYHLDESAVVFSHPGAVGPHLEPAVSSQRALAAGRGAGADPYVAKLVLPSQPGGLQLEILIRESELSPEANAARKRLIKDADELFVLELNRRASAE